MALFLSPVHDKDEQLGNIYPIQSAKGGRKLDKIFGADKILPRTRVLRDPAQPNSCSQMRSLSQWQPIPHLFLISAPRFLNPAPIVRAAPTRSRRNLPCFSVWYPTIILSSVDEMHHLGHNERMLSAPHPDFCFA